MISVFLQFMACRKPCHEPDYTFSIKTSFSSEKDSMRLGDTLWLSCETPTEMEDLNTKNLINFVGAENFGTAIVVQNIKEWFTSDREAVDCFDFIKVDGEIYSIQTLDPKRVKQISFLESNGRYNFKFGIIAKKRGLYIFTIPDIPAVVYRKDKEQCGKAGFEILSSNVDKHLYLFEDYLALTLSNYDKKHCYCIKVY